MCAALLDDDLDPLLQNLIEQWNIAERRIKKAEQVRGNEVVASAIFELRYAGRKLVDALQITLRDGWRDDPASKEAVHRYLADAIEDCVKAKHDAIDAMLDFVTRWFHETEKSLGLEALIEFFPGYIEITGKIGEIQDRIAESRGNRHLLRDQVYDEVEQDGYDQILSLFNTMSRSKDRVQIAINRNRRRDKILLWTAIVGALVGIVGLGLAIFSLS